jgi:hypothetical protein
MDPLLTARGEVVVAKRLPAIGGGLIDRGGRVGRAVDDVLRLLRTVRPFWPCSIPSRLVARASHAQAGTEVRVSSSIAPVERPPTRVRNCQHAVPRAQLDEVQGERSTASPRCPRPSPATTRRRSAASRSVQREAEIWRSIRMFEAPRHRRHVDRRGRRAHPAEQQRRKSRESACHWETLRSSP